MSLSDNRPRFSVASLRQPLRTHFDAAFGPPQYTYGFDGSLFKGTAPVVYAPPRQYGATVKYTW